MAVRDIYLKIETISGYSPVEPDDHVAIRMAARRPTRGIVRRTSSNRGRSSAARPRRSGMELGSPSRRRCPVRSRRSC